MPTKAQLNFLRMWRGCSDRGGLQASKVTNWTIKHHLPERHWSSSSWLMWQDLHGGGKQQVLSPFGADLVANADAVGELPEYADGFEPAEVMKCATCGDTGEVFILGNFSQPCGDCPVDVAPLALPRRQRGTDGCETAKDIFDNLEIWMEQRRTVQVVNRNEAVSSPYSGKSGSLSALTQGKVSVIAFLKMEDGVVVDLYIRPHHYPSFPWLDLELVD